MSWYYEADGEQKGPVEESEIQAMLADGSLSRDAKIWQKGMGDWTPAREVDAFSEASEDEDAPSAMDDARAALEAAAASSDEDDEDDYEDDEDEDDEDDEDYEDDYDEDEDLEDDEDDDEEERKYKELKRKPIPKDAAALKQDFVDTLPFYDPAGEWIYGEPAQARLDSIVSSWKLNCGNESDYQTVLEHFEAELAKKAEEKAVAKAAAKKSAIMWTIALIVGFAILMALK